jgi:ParB family chromosome partitioning protein
MAFDTSGIRLKPCVDLFSTEASRQDASLEKIREIPLDQLVPFKNHPFKVIDDESMMDTVQSIREHGILLPLIARPMPDGKYEIVSGHRRSHAGKLAGMETAPVIVRELDDDAAVILMVDSNLQRENILPSERAFAFKMKLEAIKHQGQRADLTSGQVGQKLKWSVATVANQSGDSIKQVQRYIRLTELLPELLDLVDERKLAFNSAVEVSYLNHEEQGWLAETIDSEQSTPSLSQAQRLKRFSQDGKLTEDMVLAIMSEQKKPEIEKVVLQSRQISQYFSPSATPKEMETSILSMLDTAKEWRSYFPEDNTLDDVNRRMRKVLEGMKRTKSRAPER